MDNNYEFEKGQPIIWTKDTGERVYGYVTRREKDSVYLKLRDRVEEVEIPRGMYSKISLA